MQRKLQELHKKHVCKKLTYNKNAGWLFKVGYHNIRHVDPEFIPYLLPMNLFSIL